MPPVGARLARVLAALLVAACPVMISLASPGQALAQASFQNGPMSELVQQPLLVVLLRGEVLDSTQPATIRFDSESRLSGSTGCNRFMASYQREGDRLIIGPATGTRMACGPAQMDQEQRFFQALSEVTRIRVIQGGMLALSSETSELFRLVPVR